MQVSYHICNSLFDKRGVDPSISKGLQLDFEKIE